MHPPFVGIENFRCLKRLSFRHKSGAKGWGVSKKISKSEQRRWRNQRRRLFPESDCGRSVSRPFCVCGPLCACRTETTYAFVHIYYIIFSPAFQHRCAADPRFATFSESYFKFFNRSAGICLFLASAARFCGLSNTSFADKQPHIMQKILKKIQIAQKKSEKRLDKRPSIVYNVHISTYHC